MQRTTAAATTLAGCLVLALATGCSGGSQFTPATTPANPYLSTQTINGHVVQRSFSVVAPALQAQFARQSGQSEQHSAAPSMIVNQVPCTSPQAPAKVYVTEYGSSDIKVFNQNSLQLAPVGSFAGLSRPQGIDVSGHRVYVANSGAQNIVIYDKCGGTPQTLADPTGEPTGLALDTAGNLYVANIYDGGSPGEVRYYANASGTGVNVGDPLMNGVMFVTVDTHGNVFAGGITMSTMHVDWCHNTHTNRCHVPGATWQPTGIPLNNYPGGIRIDANGNLVVNEQGGNISTYSVPGFNLLSSNPCPGGVMTGYYCMDFGLNASGNRLFVSGWNNSNAWRVNYPTFAAPAVFGPGLNTGGLPISAAAWPAPIQGG